MTMSDKSRARLPRIFASVLLGAGVAATCAAAGPASSSTSTDAPTQSAVNSSAKPAANGAGAGAAFGQSTSIVRAGVAHRLGVQPAATTPSGYAPADLQSAYNLASAAATGGNGATVAIIGIGDDPTAASDLAVYRAQYGLPACTAASGCLTKVNASGQPSPLPATGSASYSAGPIAMSMDMDMVSAICPHCRILLVERATPNDGQDLGPAVDSAVSLGAKYVIVAAGDGSFDTPAYDAEYYNHPGVAITVPAGNYGFEQSGATINFPAESPFVTTVGGTTLTRATNARGWDETVWQPTQPEGYQATSSQCATEFGKPSWQTDSGCAGRTDNDVAAVADPATGVAFYDTTDEASGWNVGGGTTVAASIVGAVYALAGTPASDSYPAAYPYLDTAGLNPVTSGSNTLDGNTCSPAYLCTAGPAYNGPAGLGTPDGTAAFAAPAVGSVELISPGNQYAAVLPETVSLQLPAEDSAGNPLTFTATGLPPGLTINPATGLISGTVTSYYDGPVSVTATDSTGATTTASFTWRAQNTLTFDAPPTQQTQPDSAATLTVHAGDPEKGEAVSYTAAGLPPGLSVDAVTGVISGTTTSAIGSYDVSLTATDGTGSSATTSFTWRVWNTITVTVPGQTSVAAAAAVNVPVSATDSASGQTLTFSAAGLPGGLSIDPASGAITGSTTAAGAYDVTVTVADGTGSQGSAIMGLDVTGKITISGPGNVTSAAGQAVQAPFTATDTADNVVVSYTLAGAPPGVYLEWTPYTDGGWQSATLTGFPAPAGTYHVTITTEGGYASTVSDSFTWTVKAAADTGPKGPVRLYLAGMCLDDTNNSSSNGNKVQIWTCNGDAAQNWTYAQDGTLRINGKCLDATGYGTSVGTKLQLWSCLNHTNQMWTAAYAAELAGAQSGLCLTDPASSTKSGTQVELGDCNEGASVTWTLPAGEITSGVPGMCVTDAGGSTANGTEIVIEKCADSSDQQWTFSPDGSLRIFGKCLSTSELNFGTGAVLEPCEGPYWDQWGFGDVNQIGAPLGSAGYDLEVPATASGTQLELGNASGPGGNWFFR